MKKDRILKEMSKHMNGATWFGNHIGLGLIYYGFTWLWNNLFYGESPIYTDEPLGDLNLDYVIIYWIYAILVFFVDWRRMSSIMNDTLKSGVFTGLMSASFMLHKYVTLNGVSILAFLFFMMLMFMNSKRKKKI